MKPFLSICIPSYKNEDLTIELLKQLEFKIKCSFCLEYVLVNDGYKANKLEEFIKTSSMNIKYIKHSENKNLLNTRITGINNATGDYITFLDTDDFITIYLFENIIKKIIDTNYLDIYSIDILILNNRTFEPLKNNGEINLKNEEILKHFNNFNVKEFHFRKQNILLNACSKIIKKDIALQAIEDLGTKLTQNVFFAEDLLLTYHFLKHSTSYYNLQASCGYYLYNLFENNLYSATKQKQTIENYSEKMQQLNFVLKILFQEGKTENIVKWKIKEFINEIVYFQFPQEVLNILLEGFEKELYEDFIIKNETNPILENFIILSQKYSNKNLSKQEFLEFCKLFLNNYKEGIK